MTTIIIIGIGVLISTAWSWPISRPLHNDIGYSRYNVNRKPSIPPEQLLLSKLYPLLNGNFKIEANMIHIDAIPITKQFVKLPFNYWNGKPGFPHNLYNNINLKPMENVNFPFPIKLDSNVVAKLPITNTEPVLSTLQRPRPGYESSHLPFRLPYKVIVPAIKVPIQGYRPIKSPWNLPNKGYQSTESPWKQPNNGYQPNEAVLQQLITGHGYQTLNNPRNEIESLFLDDKEKSSLVSQINNPKAYNEQERLPNTVNRPDKFQTQWTNIKDKNKVTFNALLNQYHQIEQQMATGNKYTNADYDKNKITLNALLNQYNALEQQESKDKYSGLGSYPFGQQNTGNKVTLEQLYNDFIKIKQQQMARPSGYVSTEYLNNNQHEKDYTNGVSYQTTTLPPPETTASSYLDKETVHYKTTQSPVTSPRMKTKSSRETTHHETMTHPANLLRETTSQHVTTPYPVTQQPETKLSPRTSSSHHKTTSYQQTTPKSNMNEIPTKEDNMGKTAALNNILSTLAKKPLMPDQRPSELLPSKITSGGDKSASALPFRFPYIVSNENNYGNYIFPFETDTNSENKGVMLPEGFTNQKKNPVLPFFESTRHKQVPEAELLNAKSESQYIPFEKPSGFHQFETKLIQFPVSTPGPLK